MTSLFWSEFGVLFVASIIGAVAVVPYSLRLLKGSGKPFKMSVPMLALLSALHGAVISGIAIAIGLIAAHAIGLGAPYIEAVLAGGGTDHSLVPIIAIALPFGIAAGATLLFADLLFLPYWPERLVEAALKTTLWEKFTASFYGGINEELLIRLCGFSVLAWLLSRVWHTSAGLPTTAVFWIVNVAMAILFGIGHLPALRGVIGKISHVTLARTLLLNAPVGLICGWLFWTYGIEAAFAAHFSADIVYHVFGTIVLRRKLGAIMR